MAHEGKIRPRVITVTVSDTRTAKDDTSGALLGERVASAGWNHVAHSRVHDDREAITRVIEAAVTSGADAVILTGGTGVSPRDVTYEAVSALLEKTLDGFGEAFRRLSWDEIGARSILSRAVAGTINRTAVVALPGSRNAVRLAMTALVEPTLPHIVALLRGPRESNPGNAHEAHRTHHE